MGAERALRNLSLITIASCVPAYMIVEPLELGRYVTGMLSAIALVFAREQGAAQAPARDTATTVFLDVSVVPLDRERVLSHQTVVVRGDQIVAMGPTGQVRVPDDAVQIDGRGKFLMPGLADMHMHIGATGPRHAERIMFLLLANGVTTIRNVDYLDSKVAMGLVLGAINSTELIQGRELLQLRARVAAGELLGPRMYTSGEWYADTSKSVAENVAAYRAAGYDFIKVHDEQRPMLDSLIDAAGRIGIPILGHPVGGLAFALEHRFTSLEHLRGFPGKDRKATLADTIEIPALVSATRQAGTWIVPTVAWSGPGRIKDPHDYRGNRYMPPETQRSVLYAGRDTVPVDSAPASEQPRILLVGRLLRALQAAGVGLLVGTDSPLIPPGYGVHQELNALVRIGGFTPYEALVTGTRNVAAYFGTLDSTGTLAVGKRADLVLLAANPLTDIQHAEQIAGVMAAGRWLSAADIERRLAAYATAPAASESD